MIGGEVVESCAPILAMVMLLSRWQLRRDLRQSEHEAAVNRLTAKMTADEIAAVELITGLTHLRVV